MKYSIVVPVYNAEKTLKQCIETLHLPAFSRYNNSSLCGLQDWLTQIADRINPFLDFFREFTALRHPDHHPPA